MEDGRLWWVLGGDRRFWRSSRTRLSGYGAIDDSTDDVDSLRSPADSRRWTPLSGQSLRSAGGSKPSTGGSASTSAQPSWYHGGQPPPHAEGASERNEYDHYSDDDIDNDRNAGSGPGLRFPEPDAEEERLYEAARLMVFGDANFPVISADPRHEHPPAVQRAIERQAAAWRRELLFDATAAT
ncbi:hypothetical protein HK405_008539, partial [Cladochytrium tenue]